MRKFAYKKRTDNQTVQRLRPLYPLWILEGVGQLFNYQNTEKFEIIHHSQPYNTI